MSALGTYILVAYAASIWGGFDQLTMALQAIANQEWNSLGKETFSTLRMIPFVMACAVTSIPLGLAGAAVASVVTKQSIRKSFAPQKGKYLKALTVVNLFEEIIARLIFMGIPMALGVSLPGVIAFGLVGNLLWAKMHEKNYEEEDNVPLAQHLPQFLAGLIFMVAFIQYGFVGALFAHLSHNMILFAAGKKEFKLWPNFVIAGAAAILAFFTYTTMEKPFSDVATAWIVSQPQYQLPNWEFWDYARLSILASLLSSIIGSLLFYDRGGVAVKTKSSSPPPVMGVVIVVAILAYPIAMLGTLALLIGDWFVKLLTPDAMLSGIIVGLLFAMSAESKGPSGAARLYWFGIPLTLINLFILRGMGFWVATAVTAVGIMIVLLPMLLNVEDNEEGHE